MSRRLPAAPCAALAFGRSPRRPWLCSATSTVTGAKLLVSGGAGQSASVAKYELARPNAEAATLQARRRGHSLFRNRLAAVRTGRRLNARARLDAASGCSTVAGMPPVTPECMRPGRTSRPKSPRSCASSHAGEATVYVYVCAHRRRFWLVFASRATRRRISRECAKVCALVARGDGGGRVTSELQA
jgi:hypothetical protein